MSLLRIILVALLTALAFAFERDHLIQRRHAHALPCFRVCRVEPIVVQVAFSQTQLTLSQIV